MTHETRYSDWRSWSIVSFVRALLVAPLVIVATLSGSFTLAMLVGFFWTMIFPNPKKTNEIHWGPLTKFSVGFCILPVLLALGINHVLSPAGKRRRLFQRVLAKYRWFIAATIGFFCEGYLQSLMLRPDPPTVVYGPNEYQLKQAAEQAELKAKMNERYQGISELHPHLFFFRSESTLPGPVRQPIYLVDMSEAPIQVKLPKPFRETEQFSEAGTVAFFKYSFTKIGIYKSWDSPGEKDAEEVHLEVCIIDTANPTLHRINNFRISPPTQYGIRNGKFSSSGGAVYRDGNMISNSSSSVDLILASMLEN